MMQPTTHLKPGDKMPDGTAYAGISHQQDGAEKALYTTPSDAPLTMTFNGAADYAYKLRREKYLGHDDWRLPTQNELNVLFKSHAAIGGFNANGPSPAGWYWSEAPVYAWTAWCQRFGIGPDHYNGRSHRASVRCVRLGEPKP